MFLNLSYSLLTAVAVLYAPWWLALGAIAASAWFFVSPAPALALALFFDLSYGVNAAWPMGLAAAAGAASFSWFGRRLIRFT
ncbi:MAG: hypothetical protein HYT47_00960 [Candidatus Vogelbacteria bacterium]|nr:hypothetical protein [Candidatus Vogelbacteria bacterium]